MSARPADYSVDSENMPEQKDYLLTSVGGAHQCLCQVNFFFLFIEISVN